MGLSGTTTFSSTGSDQKKWYKVWYTGGSSAWASQTTGSIYGVKPNFLARFVTSTGSDTLTVYFQYAVFKVTTDAAGCSSLSFAFNSSNVSGTSFAKTTTDIASSSNFPTSWSSMTKSGSTYSVSNVAMLPNTTYYLWVRSNDTTNGHAAGSSCTITGSGTYGSPGNITANDTNFDSPINMSYASATSGGTYTVKVKVGTSSEVTLQTYNGVDGSTSSRSWTPSLATYGSSYTDVSSVSCVITVSTYFGGVLSGTKTKTVTISFTAAQAGPTTSSAFSIAPYNTSPIAGMTGYIQGYSKIRATYTAGNVTLKYGATVAKWSVQFGTAAAVDVVPSTTTCDSSIISASTTVTCTITDSRGFTATETYTATITPYQNPSMTVSAFRSDSNGDPDDSGTYLCVDLSGLYADISGQNTLTVQAYSKLASAGSYGAAVTITGETTTLAGTNKTYAVTGFLISGYTDAVYDIKFVITDALGNTATATMQIESQAWAIHFRNKGAGAAIGKAAENDNRLEIPSDWEYYRGLKKLLPADEMLNLVYPVGSIYMSVNSTDPGTLFGGTWAQLENRFLLGAGSSYTAGDTGGSANAIVPYHNHIALRYTSQKLGSGTVGARIYTALSTNGDNTGGTSYAGTDGNTVGANMPPYLVVYIWKRTA